MPTETLDHVSPDGDLIAHLTITTANVEIGYRRIAYQTQYQSLLEVLRKSVEEAEEKQNNAPGDPEVKAALLLSYQALARETEFARAYLRSVVYPDYIAPVISAEVQVRGELIRWPPTFEQFIEWPEEQALLLHDKWGEVVYRLNSHWQQVPDGEEKKSSQTPSI